MALRAFDDLGSFLKKHSAPTVAVPGTTDLKARLGIPLVIDALEALSPALRYAAVFPPVPHPLLGSLASSTGGIKMAGAIASDPIEVQVRFGPSSKWPMDVKAIAAAKTSMLIKMADGIESLKRGSCGFHEDMDGFDGPIVVPPSYLDLEFRGFVFRMFVRAEPRTQATPESQQVSL